MLVFACTPPPPNVESTIENQAYMTFQDDVEFLTQYTDIVLLRAPTGDGIVAASSSLQGRVMTSSSNGSGGRSYGWINRTLFQSKEILPHMNAFGGEERFWLGPEGGQFSIYFKPGDEFSLDNWQTPPLIDLENFELVQKEASFATFAKEARLTNYSGFTFEFDIERKIEVLSHEDIFKSLGIDPTSEIHSVGYKTTNTLTNTGADWKKETGLLSIWLLGMFNPSEETTVVIPYIQGDTATLGPIVNDGYFGKVPADRLKVDSSVIYFKGDGKQRGKIGLLPGRSKEILGSYDATAQTLTILKYSKTETTDYVNSAWEIQEKPYGGDAINSYNDGPPAPGKEPMGPFYELETSSPALALSHGSKGMHVQHTFHFEGSEEALNRISTTLLGVSLEEINAAF